MITRRFGFSQTLPAGSHRVRRWGDPVMVQYGFDLGNDVGHFQGVRLWNEFSGFGGVTNFLTIYRDDIQRIRSMQVGDADSKMGWLCGNGKIIFNVADWETAAFARWGTIALGGNIVQVQGYEWRNVKAFWLDDAPTVRMAMARLKGFTAADWSRPRAELVREGLVHRAYCVYPGNRFGDSPKGEVYCPFFSPSDWDFSGQNQPMAFYIPRDWLE